MTITSVITRGLMNTPKSLKDLPTRWREAAARFEADIEYARLGKSPAGHQEAQLRLHLVWKGESKLTIEAVATRADKKRIEWTIRGFCPDGWGMGMVPPNVVLGMFGKEITDHSGTVIDINTCESIIGLDNTGAARNIRDLIANPARTVGIIVVNAAGGMRDRLEDVIEHFNYPGLIAVVVIDDDNLSYFNSLVELPVPERGLRYYPGMYDNAALSIQLPDITVDVWASLFNQIMTDRDSYFKENFDAESPPSNEEVAEPIVDLSGELALAESQLRAMTQARDEAQRQREITSRMLSTIKAENAAMLEELTSFREAADALGEIQETIDRAERERDEAIKLNDEYEQLLDIAEQERDAAVSARGLLSSQLYALEVIPDEVDAISELGSATNMAELLNKATKLFRHVDLRLMHREPALELDADPKSRAWRGKIADALATMEAYVGQRNDYRTRNPNKTGFPVHLHNLQSFCALGGSGARISGGIVAFAEANSVVNTAALANRRVFPISSVVHPEGKILMEANIKIERGGRPAPRMYFYDDTEGPSGMMHIGYIGDHLGSRSTN